MSLTYTNTIIIMYTILCTTFKSNNNTYVYERGIIFSNYVSRKNH